MPRPARKARKPRRTKAFLAEVRRQCLLANEADRRAPREEREFMAWLSAQYLDAASDTAREREARAWGLKAPRSRKR
ncbi:MAG: hypothetical protein WD775_08695 [Burkholderiales bacterium]